MPVTYADPSLAPLETEWVWEDRLPRGAVVLAAGWRQSAKGLFACHLAGAVSTGAPLPGETQAREPADVIMVTPEDDGGEDMAWRLRAAGADLDRIHDLTELDDGSPFELSALAGTDGSTPVLLAAIQAMQRTCLSGHVTEPSGAACGCGQPVRDPRLVIIDPLNAVVMYGTIKTDAGARRVIASLARVARITGVCILVIHHIVKSTGSIGGSTGLVDAVRWCYTIERTDDKLVKALHLEKCNVATAGDLRYRIIEDGHNSRIEWIDPEAEAPQAQSWRSQPARPPAANPAALGCRHAFTKFGTPFECGNCPARQRMAKTAAVPAPARAAAQTWRSSRPGPTTAPQPVIRYDLGLPGPTTAPMPAVNGYEPGLYAAERAMRNGNGQPVATSLGAEWAGLAQAKDACARDRFAAGRALSWTLRQPGVWVASLPAQGQYPAVSYGISNRN